MSLPTLATDLLAPKASGFLADADAALTMSSREVAELTGKQHAHVMRDIRVTIGELVGEEGLSKFGSSYLNAQNKAQPEFLLPKRETLILVSGYDVQLRAKIIDRWQELEQAAARVVKIDVRNAAQLTQIAIQLIEVNHELQAENAVLAPKADFYDRFANADGLYGLQNAGRLLGLGPNKFIGMLKRDYLFYQGGALVPYQRFVQQGIFEVKTEIVNDKSRPQTFITPKGIQYLAKKMGISLSTGEMH